MAEPERKKRPQAGIPEWMVTFGDMMSLLLCFFIMLFALSIITPKRFQALMDTMSQDFTGYPSPSRTKAPGKAVTSTVSDSGAKSRRISALAGGQPTPGPLGEATEVHAIQLDGVTVRVIRFDLGRYELTALARRDLAAILPVLQGSPNRIMIKGYATPSESGGTYEQDSELAFFRAVNAMDHLISLGLDPHYFDITFAPETVPARNVLPPGTDPSLAGATVEIILLNQTLR
ncbi:MAG: hypothetical protein FWE95_04265 [Planctomycetaceae bacterium]|nr:hypothetical protein [Planctomycetaceae bacterium]